MSPGRQSKALLPQQIQLLSRFMFAERLSLPQLKLAMDAPFKWAVLRRALHGEPIWILNYKFIVEWIDQHLPESKFPAVPKEKTNRDAIPSS